MIAACTVLHNICLGVGDIIPPEDNQEEEEDNVEVYNPGEAVSGAAWHCATKCLPYRMSTRTMTT